MIAAPAVSAVTSRIKKESGAVVCDPFQSCPAAVIGNERRYSTELTEFGKLA
jgi:hypothetical protein